MPIGQRPVSRSVHYMLVMLLSRIVASQPARYVEATLSEVHVTAWRTCGISSHGPQYRVVSALPSNNMCQPMLAQHETVIATLKLGRFRSFSPGRQYLAPTYDPRTSIAIRDPTHHGDQLEHDSPLSGTFEPNPNLLQIEFGSAVTRMVPIRINVDLKT
ncbi:hypothetical protein J3A83DRAFT_2537542 [Scleroderma citrinum]